MQLSIIIVSYNVKYFLEQCLCSVKKALHASNLLPEGSEPGAEVFVIDNNSSDGSIKYLRPRFPFVQFISNQVNTGFAKANNQALEQVKGNHVLFLNPDTILPEDIFTATIQFLEQHPQAGALGIRMIDGSGKFLKESKRGLPTAWASFCKMSGLTSLFPSSKLLAKYYMGHLPENKTQEVQALAGAFMMVRKEVLDKTGGFDERFFMYAEDIDLSYRILQNGYRNYYFADASIIHFKGESTSKDARYVKLFYKAMQQFVQKHYRTGSGMIFRGMLGAAITMRSAVAQMQNKKSKREETEIIEEVKLVGDDTAIAQLQPLLLQCHINIK
ncbi:MAG: glycosyltransferase family 2 protein, partial [Chitinophagaceae bacterium]